jgi:hypothetical protein
MPVDLFNNRPQQLTIKTLDNLLFTRVLDKPPTQKQCMNAFDELITPPPNLNAKKLKMPAFLWSILGFTAATNPTVSLDPNNATPSIIALIPIIANIVRSTNINPWQKIKIEDYIRNVETFMSNCGAHLSKEDRSLVQGKLESLKKITNASHASYMKQQKLKAPNILPAQIKTSYKKLMTEQQKQAEYDKIMSDQNRSIFIKKWISDDLLNWGKMQKPTIGAPIPKASSVRLP